MTYHPTLAAKATAALQEACGANGLLDTRSINELLLMGANINARDTNGNTPLMLAAKRGAADKVDYLLSCGACPRIAREYDGATAISLAADHGHAQVARKLIRADFHLRGRFAAATQTSEIHIASRRPSVQLRIVR